MLADSDTMARIEDKGITFAEYEALCQNYANVNAFKASDDSLQHFTDQLVKTSTSDDLYMILAYSRRTVNQSGDGHYSPVAAYHAAEDMTLILDVAGHKYPFHWLPGKVLWESMNELDGATRQTRGFIVLKHAKGVVGATQRRCDDQRSEVIGSPVLHSTGCQTDPSDIFEECLVSVRTTAVTLLKINLDRLLANMWEAMGLVRVYTKPQGQQPDFSDPVVLSTVC